MYTGSIYKFRGYAVTAGSVSWLAEPKDDGRGGVDTPMEMLRVKASKPEVELPRRERSPSQHLG